MEQREFKLIFELRLQEKLQGLNTVDDSEFISGPSNRRTKGN